MREAKRTGSTGASDDSILTADCPETSPGAGSGPVDWVAVRRFALLIGRGEEQLVLAVFPPQDGPCIHLPGDLGEMHRREVERTLRRHPQHALGMVLNPPLPKPEDWGSRLEDQRDDGSPKTWGASNRHIRGGVGIWAECDGGLPIEEQALLPERAGLPRPSLTVWTGGKSLHMYWLLAGGELLVPDQFRALQRRLAAAIEAAAPEARPDKGICNPSRVMRVPGGIHPKTGNRCRIEIETGPRYAIEELEAMVPAPQEISSSPTWSSSPQATSTGGSWFDRLSPDRQAAQAEAMLRHVPLRTEAGQGLYEPSLRILAGMVRQFGPEEAAAICDRAGWRSEAWDPAGKVHGLASGDGTATIGALIGAARDHGWRHPLEESAVAGPAPTAAVVITEEPAAAPQPHRPPVTFEERWSALEAAADDLAATSHGAVRLAAEMAEKASSLELSRLTRRDLESLLEAALRRRRPAADPIAPGGRFRVNPSIWVVDGLIRHGLNLLVGQSGAGKTRLALALAAAWLRGDPCWLGFDLVGGPPVEERELLILGTDQTREDWSVAMLPLGLVRDLGDGERQLHERVTLIPLESGMVLDADWLARVRRWCEEHPGGMVLADSLAQLLPPGIEEDKAAAARPVHALTEAMGSCWGLLLHHTRKAAGREGNLGIGAGRGSGAVDAAVSRVLGLGLLHKMEHGIAVPQESDPRRELISTKRGGPTVHLVVTSDSTGGWLNQGSAEALKTEERRQRAVANLTDLQQSAREALQEAGGAYQTTRQVFEAQGSSWDADKTDGGKGAAQLRKTLRRLETLGLVESVLAGNERTYRIAGSSSPPQAGEQQEPEGGEYESPDRLADLREERIPQHVREVRDADRLWEQQHRKRTEAEETLLEMQSTEAPELPAIGEIVEISDGRGGWSPGYRVTAATAEQITLISEATGRTVRKAVNRRRPSWRRPDSSQQLLLAG
jgi:hypothetical protein